MAAHRVLLSRPHRRCSPTQLCTFMRRLRAAVPGPPAGHRTPEGEDNGAACGRGSRQETKTTASKEPQEEAQADRRPDQRGPARRSRDREAHQPARQPSPSEEGQELAQAESVNQLPSAKAQPVPRECEGCPRPPSEPRYHSARSPRRLRTPQLLVGIPVAIQRPGLPNRQHEQLR